MPENDQNEKDEFFDPVPPPPSPAPSAAKGGVGKKVAAVCVALLVALVSFLAGWFGRYYALDEEVRTFLWAKSIAEKNYYQPLDEAELYARMYDALDLDPYSQLFSPDEYRKYAAEGAGQNAGVGISLSDSAVNGKTVPRLFLVVGNSPAERAGLRKGMYLFGYGASESALSSGDSEAAVNYLSAREGSFVLRCGFEADESDARNFTLARENYQASYVSYRDSETGFRFRGEGKALSLVETNEPLSGLDGETAYLRLDEFSGNAANEFVACLEKMKERGRKHLVLDIRTNGGGYLDVLGEIASHLLRGATEKYPLLATAKYRSKSGQTGFLCPANDFFDYFSEDSRICVLADENTASASECLIGALVDYKTTAFSEIFLRQNEEGVARTYGKGIMQSHYESASGAAMKLTVATINWPISGKCIHGVGVTPNDGAVAIEADLIWSEKNDVMLSAVLQRVCG